MSRSQRRAARAQELQDLDDRLSSPTLPERSDGTTPTDSTLIRLLEQLHRPTPTKDRFKPPRYDGETDVDLFIQHFQDVAQANQWPAQESTLHIRACLEKQAIECGRGQDLTEIIDNLRARFGLTIRQARDKLSNLKKTSKQSFHDLGSEIQKLVSLAYPNQTRGFHIETGLETFSRAIRSKALQHQLMARPHHTITEAVRIAEEYTQIEGATPTITALDGPGITGPSELQTLVTTVQELVKSQADLLLQMAQMARPTQTQYATKPRPRGPCFTCGGPHLKRHCPTKPEPKPAVKDEGPAQ